MADFVSAHSAFELQSEALTKNLANHLQVIISVVKTNQYGLQR
jgi:hypothetical protein